MKLSRKRKPIRLQTWIMLLVCVVLIIALSVTGILIASEMGEKTRENQAENVMDIARAVSHSREVIDGLSGDMRTTKIQAYTAVVQEDTNVDYIVVMDNDHIRRSHPVEEKIGQYFVGNDEDRAFQGVKYRSVGECRTGEYIGTAAGIVVGGIGAVLLARRVKQTLYGLEPREIAQLFQERNAMLASVREGIIAINEKDRIVIANNAAKDLFHRAGLSGNPLD